MKLRRCTSVADGKTTYVGYAFYCPGCEHHHVIPTEQAAGGPVWAFDGNLESPTFAPSLLNTCEEGASRTPRRCHLFVRAGKLEFCGDCTHPFAGRTVDIPDPPGPEWATT